MKLISKFFLLIAIIFITVGIVLYKLPKEEAPTQRVLSTTSNIATGSAQGTVSNSKCHARYVEPSDPQAVLPDQTCTPGAINIGVTQDNLYETVCKSGFTQTIRPPVSYTNKLKAEQIAEYGYSDTNLKDYEEDHLISLELGGDPNSPLNLWPEPHGSPNEKDKVENYLNQQVCSGKIKLSDAQKIISGNWYEFYKQIAN